MVVSNDTYPIRANELMSLLLSRLLSFSVPSDVSDRVFIESLKYHRFGSVVSSLV